jgi:hypothetical protein
MSTTCIALIVPDQLSQPVRVESLEPSLENLQRLVGGDVESVARGDWHIYFNSAGRINNLPPNLRASQLMHECGLDLADAARGTAVFLGHAGHGAEADVPGYLIRRATTFFGAPLAAA